MIILDISQILLENNSYPVISSLSIFESFINYFIFFGYLGIVLYILTIYKSHTKSTESLTYNMIQNFKRSKYVIKVILMLFFLFFIVLILIDNMLFNFILSEYYHLFILIIIYFILSYINISMKMRKVYSYEDIVYKKEMKSVKKIQFPKYYNYVWYGNAMLLLIYCLIYVYMRSAPFYGIWAIIAWIGTLWSSYIPYYVIPEFMILNEKQTKVIIINCLFLSWIMVFFWSSLGFH